MIITRDNLIALLNMDLEVETTGAIQFITHSATLTGAVYWPVVNALRIYTYDKINHALMLADWIKYFGGIPDIRVGKVHTSGSNEEMILLDSEDEDDAVRRYKMRIEQAEQLKEIELSTRLRTILRVKQQHAMFLKKQVCAKASESYDTNLVSEDTDDFSKTWAQNAAKVAIRTKKQN